MCVVLFKQKTAYELLISDGSSDVCSSDLGTYNLADDEPVHRNRIIEWGCALLGAPLPPLQSLDDAGLSPAARAFYSENRRVANGKAKRLLGWTPRYPSYRSEERRVGNEGVSTGRSRWAPAHKTKNQ